MPWRVPPWGCRRAAKRWGRGYRPALQSGQSPHQSPHAAAIAAQSRQSQWTSNPVQGNRRGRIGDSRAGHAVQGNRRDHCRACLSWADFCIPALFVGASRCGGLSHDFPSIPNCAANCDIPSHDFPPISPENAVMGGLHAARDATRFCPSTAAIQSAGHRWSRLHLGINRLDVEGLPLQLAHPCSESGIMGTRLAHDKAQIARVTARRTPRV